MPDGRVKNPVAPTFREVFFGGDLGSGGGGKEDVDLDPRVLGGDGDFSAETGTHDCDSVGVDACGLQEIEGGTVVGDAGREGGVFEESVAGIRWIAAAAVVELEDGVSAFDESRGEERPLGTVLAGLEAVGHEDAGGVGGGDGEVAAQGLAVDQEFDTLGVHKVDVWRCQDVGREEGYHFGADLRGGEGWDRI